MLLHKFMDGCYLEKNNTSIEFWLVPLTIKCQVAI